jgi:hypothetical protein
VRSGHGRCGALRAGGGDIAHRPHEARTGHLVSLRQVIARRAQAHDLGKVEVGPHIAHRQGDATDRIAMLGVDQLLPTRRQEKATGLVTRQVPELLQGPADDARCTGVEAERHGRLRRRLGRDEVREQPGVCCGADDEDLPPVIQR